MRIGILLVFGLIVLASGGLIAKTLSENSKTSTLPVSTPTASIQPEMVNITATFTIRTDRIVRSFKATKYHNQSPDVFITAADPTKVHVRKKGITWGDFFTTLPMKLTKECLITGDGEALCDGKQGTLRFYLNGSEDKNLLDREIKEGASALIAFTSF